MICDYVFGLVDMACRRRGVAPMGLVKGFCWILDEKLFAKCVMRGLLSKLFGISSRIEIAGWRVGCFRCVAS